MAIELGEFSRDRMIEAVQAVRERALRATVALEGAGFKRATVMDAACFIDGERGSPRDAVHLLFAGEKVRDSYPLPSADVTERVDADDYAVVSLEALARMKLNSFRDKDRTHLRDLLSLGLVDASWLSGLVPEHAARLQQLIDDPDG